MKSIKNISVIGDGGWGTTLSIHLSRKNYNVQLWGPFDEYIQKMKRTRINDKFLPGIKIPESVTLTSNLIEALNHADLIVFAVPSKFALSVLKTIKAARVSLKNKIIINVTKGIDTESLLRMSQLIKRELGVTHSAVLSGPNIASEVVKKVPSSAVIACKDKKIASALQEVFNSPYFRIYTNTDVIGLELGGSIKNVIAIACGVCDGLGFGTNTKAALITRGLSEMARLGKAMGADQNTFSGLSGLGDLVTTCFNTGSRNRTVGQKLGEGQSFKQIMGSMAMVAEGVETVKAAQRLSKRYKIPMPITDEVYNILYKGKNPQKAVTDLMKRKVKSE